MTQITAAIPLVELWRVLTGAAGSEASADVQMVIDTLLYPGFYEEGSCSIPVVNKGCRGFLTDALHDVGVPECIQYITSNILAGPWLVAVTEDCVWGALGEINVQSKNVLPVGRGPVRTIPRETISKIENFCSKHGKLTKTVFKLLLEEMNVPIRPGQLDLMVKCMNPTQQGTIPVSHLKSLLSMTEMWGYHGEHSGLYRERVSGGLGEILYKIPLRARDVLCEVIHEAVPLAVGRIIGRCVLPTPRCDPGSEEVGGFIKRTVCLWLSGIPFSTATTTPAATPRSVTSRVDQILGVAPSYSPLHGEVIDVPPKLPNPPHNTPRGFSKFRFAKSPTPSPRRPLPTPFQYTTTPGAHKPTASLLDDIPVFDVGLVDDPRLVGELEDLRAAIKQVSYTARKAFKKRAHPSASRSQTPPRRRHTSAFNLRCRTSQFGVAVHSPAFKQYAERHGIPHAPPTGRRKFGDRVAWLAGD